MRERVRAKSKALASAHAIVSGLHKLGLIDKETMREFDEACLKPHPGPAGERARLSGRQFERTLEPESPNNLDGQGQAGSLDHPTGQVP